MAGSNNGKQGQYRNNVSSVNKENGALMDEVMGQYRHLRQYILELVHHAMLTKKVRELSFHSKMLKFFANLNRKKLQLLLLFEF